MTSTTRGAARCALAAVLFGATTPLATRLSARMEAPMLAGLLYLGAAVAVVPFARRRRLDPAAARRGGKRLAAAVGAGGFAGPLLLAAGLARTPAATASLLLNTELVATALLAVVVFKEHLGPRVLTGIGLVVAAGAVLAYGGTPELRLGALLVVGACICWGLDNSITAELDELAPEHITLAKGVVAGGTNVLLGLALGAAVPASGLLLATLAVGAVGYGASITLWVAGARDLGAARGQLVFATAPFVGVAVAWLVLGEPVRGAELVALVLAAVGVSGVLGSAHEHDHEHPALEHEHEHDHRDGHHDGHHDGHRALLVGAGRHTHRHTHGRVRHAHPHVPDVHHRHEHG